MSGILATDLRCDHQTNPLCVGRATPSLSWRLAPADDRAARGIRQLAYQIRAASDVALLAAGRADLWDSGRVESSATARVSYRGAGLRSAQQVWWQVAVWTVDGPGNPVRWCEPATFTVGILKPQEWQASWMGMATPSEALPLFRRSFQIRRVPARAVAFVCGLGHFNLSVNGQPTTLDLFAPGWTDYGKTCLYVARDVTSHLHEGENVLGVILGNGMYSVTGKRYKKFKRSYGPLKAIVQLHLRFDDGSEKVIVSDSSWTTHASDITFSCIYGGEDCDARSLTQGWDAPGFDASDWVPAVVVDAPKGVLRADAAPPVRVMTTHRPERSRAIAPDVVLYDFGQNLSGFPSLTTSGATGATVKLVTGELLDEAGRVSQRNTGSPVYFQHIGDGTSGKQWRPQFSYTGYRYIEAHGDVNSISAIESCFVHSAAAVVGRFNCSSPLLNQIHELILAAVRSNLQSVMTDCPHREKLGWLEQAHLMGPAIMMNFDVAAFYAKICNDVRDAQHADGCVPTIAPEYVQFKDKYADFSNSPEWGSAAIICPWLVYQQYGDPAVLADNFDVMRRYAAYLHGRENDGIIAFGLGDWYDIGPGDSGHCKNTTLGVTGTAIGYMCNQILEKTARLLNANAIAEEYSAYASRQKEAFNRRFFGAETGYYDRGSQTAQAMALVLDLAPPAERQRVRDHLVSDIRSRSNHITAGDIGFRFVLDALADAGRSDVILDVLLRTDPPSYGDQLRKGATTLTEAWDANPKNSQNHLMLGHAELWLYRHLAGIRLDCSLPTERQVIIAPAIVGDLKWVEAIHRSAVGEIAVRWERVGGRLLLNVTIPPNQSAEVRVPTIGADRVIESGRPLVNRSDLVVLDSTTNAVCVSIGSGVYRFESDWPAESTRESKPAS